jgi:hypothetical protein
MPLFYLFWSSLSPGRNTGLSGIIALILGSVVGLAMFFFGSFVEPGGFGLSRLKSGFIDIVSLPVLLPLAVFLILFSLKLSKDFAGFALLWLIPDIWIRLVTWSAQNNPILLVLVPLLRTAIAVGISCCISLIMTRKIWFIIPGLAGILTVPITGTISYWAFFSHQPSLGCLLFIVTAIPMTLGILILLYRNISGTIY